MGLQKANPEPVLYSAMGKQKDKMSAEKKTQKIDWKQLGQFIAMLVRLYTVASEYLKKIGHGLEIVEWLDSEGKKYFQQMIVDLGGEFRRYKERSGGILSRFIFSTHKLVVNYKRTIADSVKAGNYDWKNADITDENFPSTENGEREVEMALFHFNKQISSPNAIAEMEKAGYRSATMKELLAFGEKNPELQRQFPIVALGSVVRLFDRRHVGYLHGHGSRRYLHLGYFGNVWDDYSRFLAVSN